MEVFVVNVFIKSKKVDSHLDDLRETFDILRKY